MIEILLTTLLPALLPAVGDGIKTVINKFTGNNPRMPQSIDEVVKLMAAQTERLRALAELDKPSGEISKWVANLRASSRYIAVFVLILNAVAQGIWGVDDQVIASSQQMGQSGFFFLFGDRVYMHLRKPTQ